MKNQTHLSHSAISRAAAALSRAQKKQATLVGFQAHASKGQEVDFAFSAAPSKKNDLSDAGLPSSDLKNTFSLAPTAESTKKRRPSPSPSKASNALEKHAFQEKLAFASDAEEPEFRSKEKPKRHEDVLTQATEVLSQETQKYISGVIKKLGKLPTAKKAGKAGDKKKAAKPAKKRPPKKKSPSKLDKSQTQLTIAAKSATEQAVRVLPSEPEEPKTSSKKRSHQQMSSQKKIGHREASQMSLDSTARKRLKFTPEEPLPGTSFTGSLEKIEFRTILPKSLKPLDDEIKLRQDQEAEKKKIQADGFTCSPCPPFVPKDREVRQEKFPEQPETPEAPAINSKTDNQIQPLQGIEVADAVCKSSVPAGDLKLVLPLPFRELAKMRERLDETLSLLKRRRQQASVPLKEIQASIKQSTRRYFSLKQFRQIIYVAPALYAHSWALIPSLSQNEPQLMIDFGGPQGGKFDILNYEEKAKRSEEFELTLTGMVLALHQDFISKRKEQNDSQADLYADPEVTRLWHPLFESACSKEEVQVALAALEPQPQKFINHGSQSLKSFLDRLGQERTLVKDALRLSSQQDGQPAVSADPTGLPKKSASVPPKDWTSEKIQEATDIQRQYGISLDTLRRVEQKRQALEKIKKEDEDRRAKDQTSIKFQQLQATVEFLRAQFQTKMKTSLKLNDLLAAQKTAGFQGCMGQLNSLTTAELRELIFELASMVPSFIEIKIVTVRGTATSYVRYVGEKKQTFQIMEEIKAGTSEGTQQ